MERRGRVWERSRIDGGDGGTSQWIEVHWTVHFTQMHFILIKLFKKHSRFNLWTSKEARRKIYRGHGRGGQWEREQEFRAQGRPGLGKGGDEGRRASLEEARPAVQS